jgi:hypothetical protein
MKTKFALLALSLGIVFNFIGDLLQHNKNDNWFLFAAPGEILMYVGGIVFIYKIFTYSKFREFMNS